MQILIPFLAGVFVTTILDLILVMPIIDDIEKIRKLIDEYEENIKKQREIENQAIGKNDLI